MVSLFHISLADGSVGVSLCGLNLHFLPNKILYLFLCLWEVPVYAFYWAVVQLLQSCLILCDPMDCSLPGFSVRGIPQARTLEFYA